MCRTAVVVAGLGFGLGLGVATDARAGGFGIPEVGLRRTAMAAVIGRPDEPSALYHDPAGLVLADGWRVYASFGFALVRTHFELAPWDQSDRFLGTTPNASGYYDAVRPSRAFAVIPMIAATGELWRHRLYGGAAVFVGNGTGAAFDEHAVTRYHLIDGYVIAPQAVVGLAYKLSDRLAIGATFGAVDVRVHGRRDVFPIVAGHDVSAITGRSPELVLDGSGWAPTWSVGAYGRPHPRVTWGAAIIGRIDATLDGPVQITYSADAQSPNDTLVGTQTTTQLLPWTFQGGANVDVAPQLEVGGELRYWLYRQYQRLHTDVRGIFLVRALDLERDYHDSWQASGGVRVHDLAALPNVELMAGAHYDRTPAPTRTVAFEQPTFSSIGAHVGVGVTVGRWRLGASYIHYWYLVPTITDSITLPPTNIRGSGASHIGTLSAEVAL